MTVEQPSASGQGSRARAVDPAAVMAAHAEHRVFYKDQGCTLRPGSYSDGAVVHCEPYRLADALAAEQAKVARVEALCGPDDDYRNEFKHLIVADIRAALADQPKQDPYRRSADA